MPSNPLDPDPTDAAADRASWISAFIAHPAVRRILAVLVAALVPTSEVAVAANEPELLTDEHEEREVADSALWIAQITDPHLFEEFKGGRDLTPNEVEDRRAFTRALSFLGTGRATEGRVPDALVITGDFGVDSTFLGLRQATSPLTRAQQVATLAELVGQSPVKNVFVVIGNNDLANESSDPAAFAYFHRLMDEVSRRVRSSGIRLRDLSACYAGGPPRSCTADLREGVRLVGFASASFKNSPRPGADAKDKYDRSLRALRADSSRAWDSTVVDRFAQLISASRSAGRQAIVLTHEADIDDPYARSVINAEADARRRAQLDAAVWNVVPQVRARFANAVTGGSVLGVIAGHLHSADSTDYVRPYGTATPEGGTNPVPVFVSPPLAVKNQDQDSTQARGISFYRINDGEIRREIAWLNRGVFSVARVEGNGGPSARSPRPAGASSPAGLGTPARIGIAIFAIVVAALSLMGSFKGGMRELLAKGGTRSQFRWLENLWFEPVIAGPLAGLVLVLVLFANTWDDRMEVAMWYGGDFLLAAFAAGLVIQLVRGGDNDS